MAMLTLLYAAVMIVVFLGLTIFVHELGHFIAARMCGMIVETFSLGFGPAIWKRKYNGITYKIGWIFFGGYVALPQLDPEGLEKIQGSEAPPDGERRKLPPVAPWKKIVVSLAGATGNVILAVIIAWLVYWIGVPSTSAQRSTRIGFVAEDSEAYREGLRVGDVVKSVNGKSVESWENVIIECCFHDEVALAAVAPDGTGKEVSLHTVKGPRDLKILDGIFGMGVCLVEGVETNASAYKAGIRAGDVVVEFNGSRVTSGDQFIALVDKCRDQTVSMRAKRNGKDVVAQVTPEYDPQLQRARIGIRFDSQGVALDEIVHPLPSKQLKNHATLIFRVLKALVTPKESSNAVKGMGGPVVIVAHYGRMISGGGLVGLMLAISFTCMLNVNLAIINLLPIPVLDGGLIVFSLWEALFRKPLHHRIISVLTNVFAALIITAFVLLTLRDIRWETPADTKAGRLFKRIDRAVFGKEQDTNATQAAVSGTNAAVAPGTSTNDALNPQTAP